MIHIIVFFFLFYFTFMLLGFSLSLFLLTGQQLGKSAEKLLLFNNYALWRDEKLLFSSQLEFRTISKLEKIICSLI